MKSVLLSVRPQHVANILNGLKTLEIRKKFPNGYVGWVYIYCTKGKSIFKSFGSPARSVYTTLKMGTTFYDMKANGKVVARFWCDRVETICKPSYNINLPYYINEEKICKKSCLHFIELRRYLKGKNGYAIHITNLEIFDKPKEISEFKTHLGCNKAINCMFCKYNVFKECTKPRYLTRAPESYCYIEV